MTVPEILTLLSAVTAAAIAIINAVKNPKTRALIDDTNTRVGEMGQQLNGRLAELLNTTREAAFHAGMIEGQRLNRAGERVPALDTRRQGGQEDELTPRNSL